MSIKPTYTANPDRYAEGTMNYRQCGNSGIRLPEITLGFWWHFGGVNAYEDAKAKVLHAFDHGITCFDLANNYGPPYGSAEETFGRIFDENLRSHRHEMIVTTKAGYDMWPGPYGIGSSRKMLMTSLDESLRRMKLDYVDIFYSHRYDGFTPIEETMQALIDIVYSGKALYVGLSNYPADRLAAAAEYLAAQHVHPLIYQGRYNMLVRDVEEKHVPLLTKLGVGFTAFSPLAEGVLSDKYIADAATRQYSLRNDLRPAKTTPLLIAKLKALNEIAANRGQSLAQMATAWLLARQSTTSVIIGPRTVEHLDSSINATRNIHFTGEELIEIDRILSMQ